MALIDDHMAVLDNAVIHDAFSDETLNNGDINLASRAISSSADSSDRFRRDIEERRETLNPLVEQLTAMNQHERVHAAPGDEPRGDDGLAERCCGCQYASLMTQHRVRCCLLLLPKLALKLHLQTTAVATFVANRRANTKIREGLANVIEATARQSDVMRADPRRTR